jgi:hypothetical protein
LNASSRAAIAKLDKVDQSENARDQRSEPNLKVWIQKEEFLPK